ncbi:hypothetical protein L1887_58325 [Cichorium endivia]|nr:hypothetical protein L1887_58325 [Cichorium endivia]
MPKSKSAERNGVNDGDFRPQTATTTDPPPGVDYLGNQPSPAHHRCANGVVGVFDPHRVRGLLLVWGDQGWHHSQAMLNSELGWLSEHFKDSLILQQPGQTIGRWLDFLNQWLLVKAGFADFTQQARSVKPRQRPLGLDQPALREH